MDFLTLFLVFHFSLLVFSQNECPLPSNSTLIYLLKTAINSDSVDLVIEQETFTCLAAAETLDKYRSLSAVLQYKKNLTETVEYAQFQADCESGDWNAESGEFEVVDETYTNLVTRLDCYVCRSGFPNSDDTRNCLICDSSCGGSGRCYGSGAGQCCPVYNNQECADVCPTNFVPDKADNYQCTCNFTCPAGFEPFSSCDGCNLTDICLAEQPCQNDAVCVLGSGVSDYQCNCTANFNGTNCTECTPDCDPGFSVNQDCICVATDICEIANPCQNGGTCVLDSAPYQYHCLCTNFYGSSSNCSACTLQCNNGAADRDCESCDCHMGYTGDACNMTDHCLSSNNCSGKGNCSNLLDSFECTCFTGYIGRECTFCDDRYTGDTCDQTQDDTISSQLWWWAGVPTVFLMLLLAVVSLIVMLVFVSNYNKKKKGRIGFV